MSKIAKSDAEWKQLLAAKGAEPIAFDVTRHEATEPAFTGKYADTEAAGTYHCVCCGKPLFDSGAKFDSGTGWPSYWQPLAPDAVETKVDAQASTLTRIEASIARIETKVDAHDRTIAQATGGLRVAWLAVGIAGAAAGAVAMAIAKHFGLL